MIVRKVNNDGYEHWECSIFIGLQNIEEVIVFEETHGSVGNLQMDASNAFDNSFEKLRYEIGYFVNLTDLEDLLKLSQEKGFLDTVGKWPVLKKSLEKRNSQSPVLGKEEHRASQQLFIELRACLDFV